VRRAIEFVVVVLAVFVSGLRSQDIILRCFPRDPGCGSRHGTNGVHSVVIGGAAKRNPTREG